MKNNYAAWHIRYEEFFEQKSEKERLKFLVNFAVLAPSSHNSQPWKFRVEQNSISILPETKRLLPVSDPQNRHLYIALGCALENLLVAADYYGLTPTVAYLPPTHPDCAAKIDFSSAQKKENNPGHLIFAIPNRRSNRNKYANTAPPKELLSKLQQQSNPDIQISLILDQENKNKISEIFMQSRLRAFSNTEFRKEMAGYKRTNFTLSAFGMPGFTLGINNLLSLIAPFLIKNFNVMKVIRKTEEALLKSFSPVFLFLSAKEHAPRGWILTGQKLQKVLLLAEQNGVQTAMSALPPNVLPIQEILKTSYRPEMFVRLGYALAVPGHAPRLEAKETIVL